MVLLARKCIISLSSLTLTRQQHYSLPFQTLFFSSSTNVSVPITDYLTTRHHISPETALKVSLTISHIKNPHITDFILSFLQQTGFSATQIDQMIYKYPKILNGCPKKMMEKLGVFREKGFSAQDTIAIISKNPRVLCKTSEYRIGQSITELKSVLGSTDAVCKVLKRPTWFLENDLGKTVIPNVEFLKKCSELSSSQVADYVMRFPRLFLLRPETVENGARKVCEMGLEWTSKEYLNAVRVLCKLSEEKLEHKMRFFQGLGFSDHDVLRIFRAHPHVFCYSENKINETMEVLLGSGRADPSLPLKLVRYLSYSLEKRIKPRLEVVKVLEDTGVMSRKFSLFTILEMTNSEFLERFLLSNSNALGDDYVTGITKKLAF